MSANETGGIRGHDKSRDTGKTSPASRPKTSEAQPRNRNLLNRKQAEYLALAIEKGLVVSPEELCLRVQIEKKQAKEKEQISQRRAASLGSNVSCSSWPSGGERLRTQRESAQVKRLKDERENPGNLSQTSPLASEVGSQMSPLASEVGSLSRTKKASLAWKGTLSESESTKTASHLMSMAHLYDPTQLTRAASIASELTLHPVVAQSLRRKAANRKERGDAIYQDPWRRVRPPRALTDSEQMRVSAYRLQHELLSGFELQGGGVVLRPLNTLDLVQVIDTLEADAAMTSRQSTQLEKAAMGNASLAHHTDWGRAGSDVFDRIIADDWLEGLLDNPQTALELREQLQGGDAVAMYSIVDEDSGRAVGVISLRGNAPETLRIEIARIVIPQSLGTVLVQSLFLLLQHIFEKVKYIRIQTSCCASTRRSSEMLQLGFKFEGVKSGAFYAPKRQAVNDLLIFRMLDTDWLTNCRGACEKILEQACPAGRSAAVEELAQFWQTTRLTRDTLLEGEECFARMAAKAVMEEVVDSVAAFTFDAVFNFERERSMLRACSKEHDEQRARHEQQASQLKALQQKVTDQMHSLTDLLDAAMRTTHQKLGPQTHENTNVKVHTDAKATDLKRLDDMLASALEQLKSGSSDTGSAQDKSLKEARNQLEQAKATLEQMHLVMNREKQAESTSNNEAVVYPTWVWRGEDKGWQWETGSGVALSATATPCPHQSVASRPDASSEALASLDALQDRFTYGIKGCVGLIKSALLETVAQITAQIKDIKAEMRSAQKEIQAGDAKERVILIGQKGFETGELTGSNVVLQTLQAHGGLYNGQHARSFSRLTVEEELFRFAEHAAEERLLKQYLWKLKQHDPTTFALRIGVKPDSEFCQGATRTDIRTETMEHVAGYIFARVSDFPCRCLEVGPVYLEEAHDLVYTEAWQVLLQHAVDAGMRRVEFLVDSEASSTCLKLQRLGFAFEATYQQWQISKCHVKSVVCFALDVANSQHGIKWKTLQSRRTQGLLKHKHNQCLFAPLSAMLEFKVAFKNDAIGIELSDAPPVFVKSIHATKGLGLPDNLTQNADPDTGPYLVAVETVEASGLTRKEVLALLRKLPRPVTLTFRIRSERLTEDAQIAGREESNYKAVLGARSSLLAEIFKRDHPQWYEKTPGGFSFADRQLRPSTCKNQRSIDLQRPKIDLQEQTPTPSTHPDVSRVFRTDSH